MREGAVAAAVKWLECTRLFASLFEALDEFGMHLISPMWSKLHRLPGLLAALGAAAVDDPEVAGSEADGAELVGTAHPLPTRLALRRRPTRSCAYHPGMSL